MPLERDTIEGMGRLAACVWILLCGCFEAGDDDPGGGIDACLDPDVDGDGFAAAPCGGDDCDDADADTHPGADDQADSWTVTRIDHTNAEPAIALDGGGHPWVSTAGRVQYLDAAGTWTVARDEYIGHFSYVPIAVDASNRAHIFFQVSVGDLFGDVQHAVHEGEWSYEVAMSSDGIAHHHERNAGADQDAEGFFHLAYRIPREPDDHVGVTYITNRAGAWESEDVDTELSGRSTVGIAVDALGHVHAAYPWSTPEGGEIRYATNEGGPWTVEAIQAVSWVGNWLDVAIDERGGPHVVFDDEEGALQHARRVGEDWEIERIDDEGHRLSMAADGAGHLHVGYEKGGGVWYAVNRGGEWVLEEVRAQVSPDAYARDINIAVDPSGVPHLVFSDQIDEGLYYATRAHTDAFDQDCDGIDG